MSKIVEQLKGNLSKRPKKKERRNVKSMDFVSKLKGINFFKISNKRNFQMIFCFFIEKHFQIFLIKYSTATYVSVKKILKKAVFLNITHKVLYRHLCVTLKQLLKKTVLIWIFFFYGETFSYIS